MRHQHTDFRRCDECGARPALLALTYPDKRIRLCNACAPAPLVKVAEPLDPEEREIFEEAS